MVNRNLKTFVFFSGLFKGPQIILGLTFSDSGLRPVYNSVLTVIVIFNLNNYTEYSHTVDCNANDQPNVLTNH